MKTSFALSLFAAAGLALGAFALQGTNLSVPVMNWSEPVEQHEFLKSLDGIWDADVKIFRDPKQSPFTYSGQESVRVTCGGLFATIELDGGNKDQGCSSRAIIGYEPKMSRYNMVVADRSGPTWSALQGTLSADSKTLTFTGEGPDMRYVDKVSKLEYVWTFTKKNERTTLVSIVEEDGVKTKWMEIEYKFKKRNK